MTNTSGKRATCQLAKIALVGMLTLTMHGCGQSDSEQSSASMPSTPQTVEKKPAAEAFNEPPMLPQQPKETVISSASSLIRPTDSDQRAKQVKKGRQDPFAGLFVPAVPSVVTTVVPQKIVSQPPKLRVVSQTPKPRITSPSRVAVRLSSPSPRVSIDSTPTQSIPLPLAPTPPEGVLPSPPQEPDLAKAVAITGVVQVGDEPEAIVKVPNEATSRYVKVGQRLANGQVLVKRIEISEGSDPVVILEQYGIEVAKAVGEQPVNPAPTNTPSTGGTAAPPPPPPTDSPAPGAS